MKFVFVLLLFFLAGCGTSSTWYKAGATQDDFSKDKYLCLLNSQQRVSQAEGDSFVEVSGQVHHIPSHAKDQVVTNQGLFNACMNAHGWYTSK